jgi:hypothetical protein
MEWSPLQPFVAIGNKFNVFFWAKFCNLGLYFSENEKKKIAIFRDFIPFLKIKIIKLSTCRPRHFLGHHL